MTVLKRALEIGLTFPKWRKAPQSKWSWMDGPNVQKLLVQSDDGPIDGLCYVNLDRPNGRLSNGPLMLSQFGPSKWTTVQWTAYVTSIWTVHIDDGPMDHQCYINLNRANQRRSNGPSSIWTDHWTAYIMVIWTVQNNGCGPSFWIVQKYNCWP